MAGGMSAAWRLSPVAKAASEMTAQQKITYESVSGKRKCRGEEGGGIVK
jgi:hypothetical protein